MAHVPQPVGAAPVIGWVRNRLRLRRRRNVRRMMRGYRRLKNTPDGLELVTELKDTLSRTPLTTQAFSASPLVFGASHSAAEVAVRQFLMQHIALETLHESVLLAVGTPGGRLVHALPGPWRRAAEKHDLRVAHLQCALLWYATVLATGALGVGMLLAQIAGALRRGTVPAESSLTDAAFFMALSEGALPRRGPDGRSFDLLTWYARWPGRAPGVKRLVHTVATAGRTETEGLVVHAAPGPVPAVAGTGGAVKLAWWGIRATLTALVRLLGGQWWHALMFRPAVAAAAARVQPGHLARQYLFHNSGWLFRPLWTYEAEARGSRTLFYFYSTNVETFKYASGYPLQANTWNVVNWPHYLVWDQTQFNFVRRNCPGNPIVEIVGPIWFHNSDQPMPDVPPASIAVFDIQPVRDSAYQLRGTAKVYYLPSTARAFLNDVRDTLAAAGRPMVFKRKRKIIGSFIHGHYRRDLAALVRAPHVIAIDPDIAAWRVIESCDAVISMPYTSTALLGRAQGKPSIYYVPEFAPYDPVQDDDRGAHGIPIVRGPAALEAWLRALPGRYTAVS